MNTFRLILILLLTLPLAGLAAPRIVGGSDASVAPGWMASLQARSANAQIAMGHLCGASLIAADWVMTAAHCVDGAGTVERSVLLGRLSNAVDQANEIAIDQIVLHPEWQGITSGTTADLGLFLHDIALLHLTRRQAATPITLATPSEQESLVRFQAIDALGWGATDSNGTRYPYLLQRVSLPYLGKEYNYILPDHLFAGGNSDQGICFGDSGGPLLSGNTQYGLSSFVLSQNSASTILCGLSSTLGGFTSVADHRSWILQQIQGLNYGNYQHLQLASGETRTVPFVIRNQDSVDWTLGSVASDVTLADDQCSQQRLRPNDYCLLQVRYTGADNQRNDQRTLTFSASSSRGSLSGTMRLEVYNPSATSDNSDVTASGSGSGSGGGAASGLLLLLAGAWGWRAIRHAR